MTDPYALIFACSIAVVFLIITIDLSDFLWWRKLRGGVWYTYFGNWRRCLDKEQEATALSFKFVDVEDHRYFKKK